MHFKKMTQSAFRKRSSIIAEQIVKQIRNQEYRPGMKLPPERLIAEQTGVSRPSVREAISALQIVGIVESHPGDGTYVCEKIGAEDLGRQALEVLEKNESPLELLQARKALEIGAARMVIRMADTTDMQNIRRAWNKKQKEGLRRNYDGYLKYASEFHMAIAEATANKLIVRMTENLLQATQQPLWQSMRRTYYTADPARIKEMLAVHDRIVKAIETRKTDQVIKSIEEHFDILIQRTYNLSDSSTEDHQAL